MQVPSLGQEDPLEEEMATPSRHTSDRNSAELLIFSKKQTMHFTY